MHRNYINSSVFITEGYDTEKKILELEFRNDSAIWQYGNVSARKYAQFKNAASHGNFFVTKIKGKHPENKIR